MATARRARGNLLRSGRTTPSDTGVNSRQRQQAWATTHDHPPPPIGYGPPTSTSKLLVAGCARAASACDQFPARAETTTESSCSLPVAEVVTESGCHSLPSGATRTETHCPRGAGHGAAPQSTVSSTHGPDVPGSSRAFAGSSRGTGGQPRGPRVRLLRHSMYQAESPGTAKSRIGRSCSAQHRTKSAETGSTSANRTTKASTPKPLTKPKRLSWPSGKGAGKQSNQSECGPAGCPVEEQVGDRVQRRLPRAPPGCREAHNTNHLAQADGSTMCCH
eukprot:scaffold25055_cov68-Phaeocystis_antarctica.AAC.6